MPHLGIDPDSVRQWRRWLSSAAADARSASRVLMGSPAHRRDHALRQAADALRNNSQAILEANRFDVGRFSGNAALRDRLVLDEGRIANMADTLVEISRLADPINRVLDSWRRPSGLKISKVSAPIGVIGMIYEKPAERCRRRLRSLH